MLKNRQSVSVTGLRNRQSVSVTQISSSLVLLQRLDWLYLETGKFDLKPLIQIRRLMYLWDILSRDKSELSRRVYETQKLPNSTGDWYRLIENNKKELEIQM